ncbi:hypothetical protein M9H77_02529 [Catharanthus roseus]|uniref:Uncharacterized protein n=1 Tax=Catharanthus roseus TaxID=4058 RepID=A0ACC0C8U9_CATRO|nr:hypothetical protein M9H77_00001 [Catharanthus roseus]KAI5681302.1 hypothetical protein M9H77_02529 [Catharanthus roseus]
MKTERKRQNRAVSKISSAYTTGIGRQRPTADDRARPTISSRLVSKVSRFLQFGFLDSRIEDFIFKISFFNLVTRKTSLEDVWDSIAASIFNPKLSFTFLIIRKVVWNSKRKNNLGKPIEG